MMLHGEDPRLNERIRSVLGARDRHLVHFYFLHHAPQQTYDCLGTAALGPQTGPTGPGLEGVWTGLRDSAVGLIPGQGLGDSGTVGVAGQSSYSLRV